LCGRCSYPQHVSTKLQAWHFSAAIADRLRLGRDQVTYASHRLPEAALQIRRSSWEIDDDKARGALAFAEQFGQHADDYKYNAAGIGVNCYNPAWFSEEVLGTDGVQRSAGLLISTPYEVPTGQKAPRNRCRSCSRT